MATNSKIEWTHHTFNPWRGCTKVSDGCKNCYAETMSKRNPRVLGIWGDNGTRVVASESMWREPVKWNAQAAAIQEMWEHSEGPKGDRPERPRVFCASLADVCEDRHDLIEPRIRLKRLIESTPHLEWLLLTKRPEQFLRLFYGPEWWPKNIWVGTSCENQQTADERIPHLLRVPAAVRFLSCEPLLGPIDLQSSRAFGGADGHDVRQTGGGSVRWVIAGGESGSAARPCNIDWIRAIRDQCKAAGVACFVKQLGARIVTRNDRCTEWPREGDGMIDLEPDVQRFQGEDFLFRLNDPKGGDMAEWPDDLRVRELPLVDDEPGDFTRENY